MARERIVRVRLTEAEGAALDAIARERGHSTSDVLRSALTAGPPPPAGPPTRARALELLAAAAERGSVDAAKSLARELRGEPLPGSFDAWIESALHGGVEAAGPQP